MPFVCIEKVLDLSSDLSSTGGFPCLFSQLMKNEGKNKSVTFVSCGNPPVLLELKTLLPIYRFESS